ncbi:WXG100 family type VII secretion target [uncultured Microbacterium sp.]|jgi:WXG100 family type VII secretion target|uniref:WXG100 family type VII secretion target n=1 Tax=uncultured Microbacterium sp. TaxID=191216 RepID=UPI0025CF4989|nr:WXG100 family type VII secretion target [uncultured Microbacterium sp.]
MADHLVVDFDRVSETVEALRQASRDMATTLNALDAELTVLESKWQGEAREAYLVARLLWEKQMRRMQELLGDYADVLLKTGTAIANTESELAKSF